MMLSGKRNLPLSVDMHVTYEIGLFRNRFNYQLTIAIRQNTNYARKHMPIRVSLPTYGSESSLSTIFLREKIKRETLSEKRGVISNG